MLVELEEGLSETCHLGDLWFFPGKDEGLVFGGADTVTSHPATHQFLNSLTNPLILIPNSTTKAPNLGQEIHHIHPFLIVRTIGMR